MRKVPLLVFSVVVVIFILFSVSATRFASHEGVLVVDWTYSLQDFDHHLYFGSSAAIGDVREDIQGLEVAVGSDESAGIWRLFNSSGGLIWVKYTESEESRSSPVIGDIDGDSYLDIVGGTTSGYNVEAMDRYGNFTWTFPSPPSSSPYYTWPSSPAVADVNTSVSGLEVFIGNNPFHNVWALDGDNSDGVNDGITATDGWIYGGTEGIDWDVLWKFDTYGQVLSSPALEDIDTDGEIEVVIGSGDGNLYALNGKNGTLEWSYATGGAVYSSAAIAQLDDDAALEVVVGSLNGSLYCLDGAAGSLQWTFPTNEPIYSSPAVFGSTIFVGSMDCKVYALKPDGTVRWSYNVSSPIYSSPAVAKRGVRFGVYIGAGELYQGTYGDGALYLFDAINGSLIDRFVTASITTSPSVADIDGDGKLEIAFYDWNRTFYVLEDTGSQVTPYALEWPMFRHDAMRTGSYYYALVIASSLGGTTSPSPGTRQYLSGTVVTVTAFPGSGHFLYYWELDRVNMGGTNPITITMNKNHLLIPVFAYNVTIEAFLEAFCPSEQGDISINVSITMNGNPTGLTTPYTFICLGGTTPNFTVPESLVLEDTAIIPHWWCGFM